MLYIYIYICTHTYIHTTLCMGYAVSMRASAILDEADGRAADAEVPRDFARIGA